MTLKKLCEQGTKISRSQDLKNRFEARIEERRNAELFHLVNYLKSASYIDQTQDQFGHKVRRSKITDLAYNILQRLFPHSDGNEDNPEDGAGAMEVLDQDKPMPLVQDDFVADDETGDTKNTDWSSRVVHIEMLLYETGKRRPENLERLFTALKTIKPTSFEAERAFSALGYFANGIRSQMNDDTLNALIFLRKYYKK